MNLEENKKEPFFLYSQRAIYIATFFGGPLAAGILARQNFINLGEERSGRNSLIIGVISTILLFVGIFSIPTNVIDKIPNALIPLIYTGIIYLILEKYQGSELKKHKENEEPFYSAWKAIGIGALCMLILFSGIVGYAFLSPDFDTNKYENGIAEFNKNEEKALHLFSIIESSSSNEIVSFIDNIGLPAWKNNLLIIDDLDKIEGLYDEFKEQNEILIQYSNLRIEIFELIRKAVLENSNIYDEEIDKLNLQIEGVLKRL